MTKIERVKLGLKCCSANPAKCDECPYMSDELSFCDNHNYLLTDALDIIGKLERKLNDEHLRRLRND